MLEVVKITMKEQTTATDCQHKCMANDTPFMGHK